LVTGTKSDDTFEEAFKFVLPGYNVRPIEMSGAIGIEQLKKLPSFIQNRQENAKLFVAYFKNHPYLQIQKETEKSSWFGFSLVIKENAPYTRKDIVGKLQENGIECRPIVTGNFLKNKEVLQYFDYEVAGSLENAEYIDQNGLFVGNHQVDIKDKISDLHKLLR
jgi:CDP-6-deoxy-D-xylo-4-hexulose-3-dehydrase